MELYSVHLEELYILSEQRVFRFADDFYKRVVVKLVKRDDYRQAPDKLGDKAELDEIVGDNIPEDAVCALFFLLLDFTEEPDRIVATTPLDDFIKPVKSAAAYKENVFGVYLNEFLVRVLPAALRGNV